MERVAKSRSTCWSFRSLPMAVPFPLLWTVLPSCGASDTRERIELMTRFLAQFGPERWQFVTADREVYWRYLGGLADTAGTGFSHSGEGG